MIYHKIPIKPYIPCTKLNKRYPNADPNNRTSFSAESRYYLSPRSTIEIDNDFIKSKSRVTRRWAQKHPGTKSGKQEETPCLIEAGSVCVCGRSTSFVEPGWNDCTSAQVWPRHQAVALFSELALKVGADKEPHAFFSLHPSAK